MVDKDHIVENGDENTSSERELPLSFTETRHVEAIGGIDCITQTWRMKERMKTVSVALVLCLNVGVDPPDIVKTQPCARLECWIDPLSLSPPKALEAIGANLQKQYERWQPRARYKLSLDPTAEEVKKLCTSLRRNAKEERVLFHYNGHGVPKPTSNGEIWTYTQYIPLSVYDLQTWMGAPSIYVYDCSNAGIIVETFKQFAIQHENEYEGHKPGTATPTVGVTTPSQGASSGSPRNSAATPPPAPPALSYRHCIQLAACGPQQVLPMNPDLPADLFTACLTTPIKVALRWFVMQTTSKLVPNVTMELVDKIPGQITDRRTMLGELNWIFTAITDTIAWNTLPRDLFQKLFRQDLLVASLFRNFLLAERILRSCDCTPVSSPALPPTYQHPMWQAWDLALDLSLGQLPAVLERDEPFVHLPFFEEQLTAFQVWLELGSEDRSPPEQLPIVLQVLLSQVHRMRALELLGRFLDLGPWAVNLALSVGIFPYVLKLLQSCARELRPLLVFIWAKILAVDSTCQADLVRDTGHKYFLSVLQDTSISAEHRTQSAFVLACIVNGYRDGQEAAVQGSLVSVCLEQLAEAQRPPDAEDGTNSPRTLASDTARLRQWLAICLGRLWDGYEKARWTGVRDTAHEKLYALLNDDCAEVRAAAVYALGTFVNSVARRSEHANTIDHAVAMTLVRSVAGDMSALVRRELVAALQWIVLAFETAFVGVAAAAHQDGGGHEGGASNVGHGQMSAGGGATPPGGTLRRIGSRDRLRIMSPSTSHASDLHHQVVEHADRLKRVASSNSISTIGGNIGVPPSSSTQPIATPSAALGAATMGGLVGVSSSGSLSALGGLLAGLPYASVYSKLWAALVALESDPHPDVAQMAKTVTAHVRNQVKQKADNEARVASSVSLPPSPNRTSYLAESPPTMHSSTDLHRLAARGAMAATRAKNAKLHPSPIAEVQSEESEQRPRRPLVETQFVQWSCKHFAQPSVTKARGASQKVRQDVESKWYYEREWRYMRNANIRREARDEQLRAISSRLESQVFNTRTQTPPAIVQFHPYDQHIAVAGKDAFSIWDWGTGAKLCHCQCKFSSSKTSMRLTALEWVNACDVALLMTACDEGSVRLWRPQGAGATTREPTLVSAWQAHTDLAKSSSSTSVNSNTSSTRTSATQSAGVLLTWEQYTQHVLTAGDSRAIRLWDARRELRSADIQTGADCAVTCLDSAWAADVQPTQNSMGGRSSSHSRSNGTVDEVDSGIEQRLWAEQADDAGLVMGGAAPSNIQSGRRRYYSQPIQRASRGRSMGDSTASDYECSVADIDGEPFGEEHDWCSVEIPPMPSVVTPIAGLIACGCADGSVRIFDRRCAGAEARVKVWMEHGTSVLGVQLRGNKVISGSASGDVRIYDIRKNDSILATQVVPSQNVTAIAIHRKADTYACGSSNQTISIHNLSGLCLNVIRSYEGFMGYRIGPVSCLSYHPHRVALATGTLDCSISVYCLDNVRTPR